MMISVNGDVFRGAITDPSNVQQAYNLLQKLKQDAQGWKNSANILIEGKATNIDEQFLLLQVIEEFLVKRYANEAGSATCIRNLLTNYIERLTDDQPPFLLNKWAHIFSLVFAVDFPERWPNYIDDLFLSRDLNSTQFVIFYLKTLLAIDTEVVDRDIQRTQVLFDRNTKIKDFMRDICIKQMVESWFTIMNTSENSTAQSLCLEVVAAYIDWIDVELVANDAFMPIIISRLSNNDTTEAAIHAITALMQKGMPSPKKLSLIVALGTALRESNLIGLADKSEYEDVNRVGSLLNCMGLVLLDCQAKFRSNQAIDEATQCITLVEPYLDTMLMVLNNEEPELSELVVDTLTKYAQLVREDLSPERSAVLGRIVTIALERFVMGDHLEVDGEGEDELDFTEYRKELKSLLNQIGMKRPDLVVAPLEASIDELITGSEIPIRKLEAIGQLVYSLSELIPSNFVQKTEGWLKRAEELPLSFLKYLRLDGRSANLHVLYFEIACRYDKLLAANPQPVVTIVAEAFLDARGIAIPVQKVRVRIVYLFCRFVKAHKTVLSPLVSQVIQCLAPLLAVSPQADQFLSPEDQSFIFESTATLIVFGEIAKEQKADFIRELATNLVTKFQSAVNELQITRVRGDANTVKIIENFMVNIIGYCSRITKAFNNTHSMKNTNCIEIFMQLLEIFLEQLTPVNAFLLEPVRQLAHRMVVCLDEEIMPVLPILMEKLSGVSNTLDTMNQLLIFTHQIVAKHKKASLKSGVNFQVILTTAARFAVVDNAEISKQEESSNLLYVRRAFVQLMSATATNEMLVDIAGDAIEDLLEATTRLALGSDQASQKIALLTLSKTASLNRNWYARALRAALEVPVLPHISPSDAGSSLVVHEVANTLIALRQIDSTDFTNGVNTLVPSVAPTLLNILDQYRGKELDKNIMQLYAQVKAQ